MSAAALVASALWVGPAAADAPATPAGVTATGTAGMTFGAASSPSPDRSAAPAAPRHRTFGMSMDLGVPDGAAVGLVVRPRFDWLRLGAAVTYNAMAPGVRLGVTLDPIAFPIAPTFTAEGGHAWQGQVPGVSNSPDISYNYANFHIGIETGNRATFRFFLRGGVSFLDLSASHLDAAKGGSSIGDPSYNGWVAPSGKLGFSTYF